MFFSNKICHAVEDELMCRNGYYVKDLLKRVCNSNNSTWLHIFTAVLSVFFLSTGSISKNSSLFTYDSEQFLDTYYLPPCHDPAFIPAFTLPEEPDDLLVADMLTMCFGEGAEFCRYDTLTTRSLAMGNATLRAYRDYQARVAALEPGTM